MLYVNSLKRHAHKILTLYLTVYTAPSKTTVHTFTGTYLYVRGVFQPIPESVYKIGKVKDTVARLFSISQCVGSVHQ